MIRCTLRWMSRMSAVAWLAGILVIGYWALDREPPAVTTGSSYEPPIFPGSPVRLVLYIRRDLTRSCAVSGQRWVQDALGQRIYLPVIDMGPGGIEGMEEETPGEARILFDVHPSMVKGMAAYRAELAYVCNPLHHLWPIYVNSTARFLIE